jgi:hypothetical protein
MSGNGSVVERWYVEPSLNCARRKLTTFDLASCSYLNLENTHYTTWQLFGLLGWQCKPCSHVEG